MTDQRPSGDPDLVLAGARRLRSIAGELAAQRRVVQATFVTATDHWSGPRERRWAAAGDVVASDVDRAGERTALAANVIAGFAARLRAAQEESDQRLSIGAPPRADLQVDVRRAAERAARELDALAESILPGAADLDPGEIRRRVVGTGTIGGPADGWARLLAGLPQTPIGGWQGWAGSHGLELPAHWSAARATALQIELDQVLVGASSPDPRGRSAAVQRWAAGLDPQDLALLAMFDADRVGNLDGIPTQLRYAANQVAIVDALETEIRMQNRFADAGTGSATRQLDRLRLARRIGVLEGLTGATQVLAFRPPAYDGLRVVDDGRLAVVDGDLDRALTIGVVVPGILNRLDNADELLAQTTVLHDSGGPDDATITWLGYDTPDLSDSVLTGPAQIGGAALARFVVGLPRRPGSSITIAAHSYGTLVTAQALPRIAHWGRDALPDRVVLFGSPGLGSGVRSTADLGLPPGYPIFALRAPDDFVGLSAAHGLDPVDLPGVVRLDTDPHAAGQTPISGHLGYLDPGSASVSQIAGVIDGRADLDRGGAALDDDGALGPYSSDTRRLIGLLQQRVPATVQSRFVSYLQAELDLHLETGTGVALAEVPAIVALLRRAAQRSGLTRRLSQDDFEEALIAAGFTRTTGALAGRAAKAPIDRLDLLDGRRIGILTRVPPTANETVGSGAAVAVRAVTWRLSDMAVRRLPSLDRVLGAAAVSARILNRINSWWDSMSTSECPALGPSGWLDCPVASTAPR